MNRYQASCDQVVINAFINEQLSADELAYFERHLDECAECRERLQQHSADEQFRVKAADYLADEPSLCATGVEQQFSVQIKQVLDWLAPTDEPRMLGRIGNYEVLAVIGSGGMGVVLKALDPGLNRVVAVKVLAPHLAASDVARRRFAREAQAAAAITHDNVIDIYSVSEFNGLPYLVMPYARGPSLQERLNRQGPLPLVEVLRIGHQIGCGLMAAHEQGLVHRDVKPANILLTDDVDRVLITDFGLARAMNDASVTNTGVIAGTPHYMSPEQARGEEIDGRSDLFALGSVIYTLCTATPPFRAESHYGVLRQITDGAPQPIQDINSDIPEWLSGIVARLHSQNPDERFQSAGEVAEELRRWLAYVQSPSTEQRPKALPGTKSRTRHWKRAHVVAGLMASCFIGYLAWPYAFRERTGERNNGNGVEVVSATVNSRDVDFVARKHMKAIVFAIHSYADANEGQLPPAIVANDSLPAERRLSGIALLLPYFKVKPSYLDHSIWETVRMAPHEADKLAKLFASIDLKKAWDDPVNLVAARTQIGCLLMPDIRQVETENGFPVTHVAFVRGYGTEQDGAFPGDNKIAFEHISDGTSKTLAIGQVSENLGPWIAAGEATSRFLYHHDEQHGAAGFGGPIPGIAFFAICDGSLRLIDLRASTESGLQAIATRAGEDDQETKHSIQFYDSVAQYLLHKTSEAN